MDADHQIIVAADITGSGSEQSMLLPMIEQTQPVRDVNTLITADAAYYSDDNVRALHAQGIPSMIADKAMRQRDERIDNAHHKAKAEVLHDKRGTVQAIVFFKPEHFTFNNDKGMPM